MKIIKKTNDIVAMILGNNLSDTNTCFKTSKFLLTLKYKGTNLVYSLLTNGLFSMSDEELVLLKKPEYIDSEIKEQFLKEYLIFPINTDECKLSNQLKNVYKALQHDISYIDSYTILTTTECNARCFYCYENGLERVAMPLETSNEIARYIMKHCHGKKVSLKWFGGEPLFNFPVIDNITNILKNNNIEYVSQMTTNGYLFDDELVRKAVNDWHLKKTQITLDGTESVYNRYKAYIYMNDISPFVRVTDNIELLINAGVTVNVRLNMDENNAQDLYDLVMWLSKRFPSDSNLHVYVAIIFNKNEKSTSEKRIKLLDSFTKLNELIAQKHLTRYRLDLFPLETVACMANNPHAVVITPKGELQRCEHITPDETYGNVWNDEIDKQIYNSWFEKHDEIEECRNCEFYPNCNYLKKCKTLIKCTEDERMGKTNRFFEAMRWQYDQWLSE